MSTELFEAGPESEPTALPKWVNVERCLTADCIECDTGLGNEDEGVAFHFSTLDELRTEAEEQGWTITADGLLCDECAKDAAP